MIKVIKLNRDNIINTIKIVDIDYVMESDDIEVPMNKYVDLGGLYNEGTYTAPVEPEISQISIGSFRRRLTIQEKVAIRTSTDPVVQVLVEDLASSSYVDLKEPQVLEGLGYLVESKILTEARLVEVTKEGTANEI